MTEFRALNIALVCPVYPPEIMPSAIMLAQLANDLRRKGHKVTVYTTFPSLPEGRVFDGYTRRLWKSRRQDGLRVIRCFSFTIGERRARLWRGLSHLSFGLMSALRLLWEGKPDVIIAEMAPIISSPFIILAAKLLRVPVANYIKDLFPEAVESAAMIRPGGIAARVALWIDKITCLVSDVNIVLSESFKVLLQKSRMVPADKIEVINDWIDGSNIKPTTRHNSWREEMSIPEDKFVAMYAGTMGLAGAVDVLVDTAAELKKNGHDDILLICIGEGLLKPEMIRRSAELGLDNIRFLPFQPQERISEAQSTADVLLLTMDSAHTVSSVPSKLITYMAVGRPVLCTVDRSSSIGKMVADAGCGMIVPPENVVAISKALVEMKTNRSEWQVRGARGREFFEERLDIRMALKRFEDVIGRLRAT
jgi:colanic acid biosynthesis glycosyl transferase WcaI